MVTKIFTILMILMAATVGAECFVCDDWSECAPTGYKVRSCMGVADCEGEPTVIKSCDDPDDYENEGTPVDNSADPVLISSNPESQDTDNNEQETDNSTRTAVLWVGLLIIAGWAVLGLLIGLTIRKKNKN